MTVTALLKDDYRFPDPQQAVTDPNGLLAVGGDLSPQRLLAAYSQGIFPWFDSDADPILWWSPEPRAVLAPAEFKPRRSLRKVLRRGDYRHTMDQAFAEVIDHCAHAPRNGQAGTWITPRMQAAYRDLHELGYAHSVETWAGTTLVGGLYGLSLGRMFFGESMFSLARDASKCAFATLCAQLASWNFSLLDCQMMNDHLASLGVREVPRHAFLAQLARNDPSVTRRGPWHLDLAEHG